MFAGLGVVALLVWVAVLALRLGEVRERLKALETKLLRLEGDVIAARPTPAPAPKARRKAEPAPEPAAAPETAYGLADVLAERIFDRQAADAAWPAPRVDAPPPRRTKGPEAREQMAAWLSENGLAWIGGAVLALGGLFMVTYAAQRGFFSPAMRIGGAVLLGGVLLGVSEWLRRLAARGAGGHPLAAAAAAGAGAATLYAATWASYWLYSFIRLGTAGGLLALIAFGLLALSVLYGEPLAILAIGGALLAPVVTGPQHWTAPALTGYLALVVATGYAMAGARRWGLAGLVTLAGAGLWALAGYAAGGWGRVAALAVAPVALSILALEWRRRRGEALDVEAPEDSFTLLPTASAVVATLLLAPLWLAHLQGGALVAASIATAALAGLSTLAVRRGLAPAYVLLAGSLGSAAMVAAFWVASGRSPRAELWAGLVAAAAAATALWSALPGRREPERLWAGAGALAVLLIALSVRGPWTTGFPWVAPVAGLVLLTAGAGTIARRAQAPERDLALAFWLWCAAAALIAGLRVVSPPSLAPTVLAVASAGLAFAHTRLGWRGFAAGAIAAALASLGALLSPDLLRPLFGGHLSAWPVGLAAALAAAVVFGGSRQVRASEPGSPAADALSTGALLIALTGAFLLLRLWGAEAPKFARVDPFLEASLRTLLILAAGLLSASAVREDSHPIGRWRGHVLIGLGVLHGLVAQVVMFNPLAATWVPAVSGPPLADSLAVGFLAPALLLAAATRRAVTREVRLLPFYAASAVGFAGFWTAEEIRRLFQGATLAGGHDAIGRAEAAAYAVAALAFAAAWTWLADRAGRRDGSLSPIAGPARQGGVAASAIAVVFAVFVFGYAASPWWGPIGRPLDSEAAAALLLGLYASGAGLLLWLTRAAEAGGATVLARGSRAATVLTVFVLLTLAIRWAFRGLDMRPVLTEASVETWTFSAVWGLYGFGLLVFAAARREADLRWAGLVVLLGTTAKVFLFDMARLEGVVRAGSFLAVGALLLAAAVVARRLSGGFLGFGRRAEPDA